MATEKVVRLGTATITFYPNGATKGIELAYNQNISLNRSSDKKEAYSNDTAVSETVMEVETKSTYEFETEISDLKLDNLAIAFKGLVEEKTYEAGDIFPTGKTIRANTDAAGIGELILSADGTTVHIATEEIAAGEFAVEKCADKTYKTTVKKLRPQAKTDNFGKIVCDGKNHATGDAQILVIPSINLGFDGGLAISGNDFAKITLKGKCLKKDGEDIFELIDA